MQFFFLELRNVKVLETILGGLGVSIICLCVILYVDRGFCESRIDVSYSSFFDSTA